jgi:hypothetical protein
VTDYDDLCKLLRQFGSSKLVLSYKPMIRVGKLFRRAEAAIAFLAAQTEKLTNECKELHERVAFAESKEVCTKPHSDEVLAFCPYCKIEALQKRVQDLWRERNEALRHFGTIINY